MKRYVVIGNGVAGATAVDQIRAVDSTAKITVFTKENHSFYYRPRLPEFLAGEMELKKFTMRSLDDYKGWGVDLRLHESVEHIDPVQRLVQGDKNGEAGYDALLLAMGAEANMPPIKGSHKKGVFTLRTVDDALRIKQASQHCREAILVGGGLLGLEAGHALVKLGLKVKVVEFFDRLMPRQMDQAGADILQAMLEKMGFSFYLGARSKQILGEISAQGLELEDGRSLEGNLVLCSAGICPNLNLARQLADTAGLRIDKGIVVDEHMFTGIKGIWAAGDVAEFKGMPGGIWPSAMAQGRIAGRNMAGENDVYEPKAPSTSLKVAGIKLTSAGDIDADNKCFSVVCKDDDYYRKIVLDNQVIRGFIFLGDDKGVSQCTAAMNSGKNVGNLAEQMQKRDFDFDQLK